MLLSLLQLNVVVVVFFKRNIDVRVTDKNAYHFFYSIIFVLSTSKHVEEKNNLLFSFTYL